MIDARGIRKTFTVDTTPVEVLRGVDLVIPRGEFVTIMGPSGAGKSTLLHVLGALERPTEGTVTYNGEDIFAVPPAHLPAFRNDNIGFVFQFHYLLQEFSARENIRLAGMVAPGGPPRDLEERVTGLLAAVGLSDREGHRPGQLSGGERQRVAIARALVMEPRVVYADEPTGNLDTRTGNEVFDLLRKLNRDRGVTVVMVTHNEALAEKTDRVVTMRDGLIEG